jgi:DNA repair photolyase
LEVLLQHDVPVSILTKSDLVLRDIDLLSRFSDSSVGMSMGISDDAWAQVLEPRASLPSRRVAALRALHAAGISTNIFISPFIPGVSDLRRSVEALAGTVEEFGVEAINTDAGNWQGTLELISRRDSSLARTSARLARDEKYWREVKEQAVQLAAQAGMEMTGFFHHRDSMQRGSS